MEFVLELILEIAELAVRESKYKSVRSRTRAITAFYGVIAAVILGFGVFLTISMLCKGDRMAAASLAAFLCCWLCYLRLVSSLDIKETGSEKMDNYAIMLSAAKVRFCTYDMEKIASKYGVSSTEMHIYTTFLGEKVEVEKKNGEMLVGGRPADFSQGLTVFDWLCDRKDHARASFEFCPVSSLPGVLVSGGTLVMNFDALAAKIDKAPEKYAEVCKALGGTEVVAGDIGFQIMAFPDLPVLLKFYRSDEEFPASLHMMWDKNILQFIRYETVYYLAGCFRRRLETLL